MEKIKQIILFVFIFVLFNDTLVVNSLGLIHLRIIYGLFLIIFSVDILNSIRNIRGIVNISIISFLILLIIFSIIYLFTTQEYPFEHVFNMILLISIVLTIYNNKKEQNRIKIYILISITLSALYCIFRIDTLTEWTFRKTGGVGDANEFSSHLIIALLLTWNYIKNIIAKFSLISLFVYALILSGSITGGLCFLSMTFYKILSEFKNKLSLKNLILSIVFLTIGFFLIMQIDSLNIYLNRAFNNSANFISRQNAWTNGLMLFRENWYTILVGGGPNFFDQRNLLLFPSNANTAAAAHSMYIEILADTGLIGLIMFILPIFYISLKNIFNPKYDMLFAMLFMSLSLSMSYEKYFWLVIALIL